MQEHSKLKILFVGTPDMAIICLEKLLVQGFNIVGVVPPLSNHNLHKFFIDYVHQFGIRTVVSPSDTLKEPQFLQEIKSLEPDIAVVCSYDKKFPKEFLETTKLGFLNSHPSLLPQYRGGNPYFHAINNNESVSGITIHFMDENFDTGDIVYQHEFELAKNETLGSLFTRTNHMIAEALVKVLRDLEETGKVERTPQVVTGNLKGAPNLSQQGLIIDWDKKATDIERFIRACNPFMFPTTVFRGVNIKISSATYGFKNSSKYAPGTICEVNDVFGISTMKGIIYPQVLHVGSLLVCDNKEFVKRFSPQVGEIFKNG